MESWSPYDTNPPQYKHINTETELEPSSEAAFFDGKIYSCGGKISKACYTMTPGQVGEEWTKSPTAKFLVTCNIKISIAICQECVKLLSNYF